MIAIPASRDSSGRRFLSGLRLGCFLPVVVLLCSLLAQLRCARAAGAQTIHIEPQTKLIPGGSGQKPFNVTRHTIPLSAIESGGVARDAIPALVRPNFVAVEQVRRLLKKSDRVLGVFLNGEAKAYPVGILNWHELVNDEAGGQPILVSW